MGKLPELGIPRCSSGMSCWQRPYTLWSCLMQCQYCWSGSGWEELGNVGDLFSWFFMCLFCLWFCINKVGAIPLHGRPSCCIFLSVFWATEAFSRNFALVLILKEFWFTFSAQLSSKKIWMWFVEKVQLKLGCGFETGANQRTFQKVQKTIGRAQSYRNHWMIFEPQKPFVAKRARSRSLRQFGQASWVGRIPGPSIMSSVGKI